MKCNHLVLAAGLVTAAASCAASAAPWIEMLPEGFYVTDLSYDGSAGAGNITGDGTYETFRWTRDQGVVPLGRASVPALGIGGGSPDISYDGERVSASIVSSDGSMLTLGVWSLDGDWQEAFSPLPPFITTQDNTAGSAWGLSGDGNFVTGYYVSNQLASHVQPCSWSADGTLVNYPANRARVNCASYNGSVVGGWDDFGTGPWTPTVWRNGVPFYVALGLLGSTQVNSVNIDGSVAVGDGPDEYQGMKAAAIWRWNGTSYEETFSGYLPDTTYGWGSARFTSVSDDGKIAVGSNNYAFNPNQGGDGIIWTPETGLMSGTDFLASLGLSVPENIELRDFQCISPDGSTIAAAGVRVDLGIFQTFLIHLHEPCAADMNSDWQVDDADFVQFANSYDILDCSAPSMALRCPADINRDGMVDDADFVAFASAYDQLICP
ncbi:MAG: hypothetical protein ACREJD_11875 [Phycisphaerales bacterium]